MKKLSSLLMVIVSLLSGSISLNGQSISIPEYIAPPPEAAGLTSRAAINVSHYTGNANISIPIYTIQSKGISLPITLDYTGAGGITVSEDASWVGLGWNLNCTGAITRQIRGKDDLYDYWFESTTWLPDDPLENSYTRRKCDGTTYLETFNEDPPYAHLVWDDACMTYQDLINLKVDGVRSNIPMHSDGSSFYDYSSDIYSLSIPGFSGQFMFDTNKNPVFLKPNGNRMEWFKEDSKVYWKLTTTNGIVYLFRHQSYTKSETRYSDGAASSSSNNIVSGWYLTEIISPKKDTILIEYDTYGNYLNERMRRIPAFSEKHATQVCSTFPTYPAITEYLTTPSYIKAIYFDHGKLSFERQTREDLVNGERLDRIKLYKIAGGSYVEERQFVFDNNHYFTTSSTGYSYHSFIPSYDQQDRKRLQLQRYYEVKGAETRNSHSFDYNSVPLPVKSSFSVDHWGFYNGYSNQTFIPTNSFMNFSGANRNPNSSKVTAGMLKTIHYPTGGKVDFDFIASSVPAGVARPGALIERISEYDPVSGSTKIQRFEYLGATPNYIQPNYLIHKRLFSQECMYFNAGMGRYEDWPLSQDNYFLSSETVFPFSKGAMGGMVGFSKVTKYLGENGEFGKSEFYFKNDFTEPRANYAFQGNYEFGAGKAGSRFFYDYEAEYYDKRINGRLEHQIDFENGGGKVKEVVYTYDTKEDLIWNGYVFRSQDPNFLYAAALYWYGIPVVWDKLIKTEETLYSTNGPDIVKTVDFAYESDPKHYQILSQSTIQSDGLMEEIKYKYPSDYSSPAVSIQKLKEKNFIVPIEQTKLVDSKVVAGIATKYSYNSSTDLVLPDIAYQIETTNGLSSIMESTNGETFDSNYKRRLNYELYDGSGNLIRFHMENDISTSFLWGYGEQYPIAKAINAAEYEIAYTSFEGEDSKGGWSYTHQETISPDCQSNCEDNCTSAAESSCANTCSSSCNGDPNCYNSCMSGCVPGTYAGCMNGCMTGCSNSITINTSNSRTGMQSYKGSNVSKSSLPTGRYKIGYWVKKSGSSSGTVTINGSSITISNDDWAYNEFTTPGVISSITVNLSGVYIDELRLQPIDAQMTTYTYDPLIGMTSQTDPAGQVTTFEYDDFGRLETVRDSDGNVLQHHEYNYKQ